MDYNSEILKALQASNDAFESFRSNIDDRLGSLEAKAGRPNLGGNPVKNRGKQLPQYFDPKTQRPIPILGCDDSLAATEQKSMSASNELPSMGRVLRGIVMGSRAHDAAELEAERKALNIGSGVGGGFTVRACCHRSGSI